MEEDKGSLKVRFQDGLIITGGHFMIGQGGKPELNKGTIESFRAAAKMYKEGKEAGHRVGLGLLINDIGAVCGSGKCSILPSAFSREGFGLPTEYLKIMDELKISAGEVDIYWEKHMRNRGKKLLVKKISKTSSVEIFEGDHWLVDGEGIGVILSRKREQDKYGNAACPLIMAAFHMEQERRGFSSSINIYYIGADNGMNIPNHPVIEHGRKVAEELGSKIQVKNLYME